MKQEIVKCIEPKNYSLTYNKFYPVLNSNSDLVIINNDSNMKKIYKRSLFESTNYTIDS